MGITMDIAGSISAVTWPIIVLAILPAYRSRISMLAEGVVGYALNAACLRRQGASSRAANNHGKRGGMQ